MFECPEYGRWGFSLVDETIIGEDIFLLSPSPLSKVRLVLPSSTAEGYGCTVSFVRFIHSKTTSSQKEK
jgi:hypothetical protein